MGFRVPRVTFKVDYGDDASFGELSLVALGYGLHQAWIYSTMFDKGGIFGHGLLGATADEPLSFVYLCSILVYGMLLLLASAFDTKLIKPLHSARFLGAAAVLGVAGTAVLFVPADSGSVALALQLASGVLTGVGSAVLLLAWGIAFARFDPTSIALNGAVSIAVGFGVYGLVLHQLPYPIGGALDALIPLAELLLLLNMRRSVALDFDSRELMFSPLPINHARFVLRFGIPVFLLGAALGIMRQTSIENILPAAGFEEQSLLFCAACLALVLIVMTLMALSDGMRWHSVFKPLLPLVAVTVVCICFLGTGDAGWVETAVLVGYMLFEAMMWIFFGELAQQYRLSPIFVFGLGRGVMALATLGGTLLPLVWPSGQGWFGLGNAGCAVVVLLCMMMAYAAMPGGSEMGRLVSMDSRISEAVRNFPRIAPASDGAQGQGELDSEPLPASGEPGASASATMLRDSLERLPAKGQPSDDSLDPMAGGADRRKAAFRERCEAVANTYLLSGRESEVLYFLARGYKSGYIQQKLYISEGTAKTHIRHIYGKANVHNQQELMRLVDEVDLSGL